MEKWIQVLFKNNIEAKAAFKNATNDKDLAI